MLDIARMNRQGARWLSPSSDHPGIFDHALSQFASDHQMLVVSSYASAREVLIGSDRYSSEIVQDELGSLIGGTLLPGADGVRHTQLRNLLEDALTGDALDRFVNESVEPRVASHVAELRRETQIGLVEGYAAPVAASVACDLLGVYAEHAPHVIEAVTALTSFASLSMKERLRSARSLRKICAGTLVSASSSSSPLLERVRAGLASGVLENERDAVSLLVILMIASVRTTADALASALLIFSQDGPQWRSIPGADLSGAIRELLRLYPPAQILARRALEPDVLSCGPVEPGQVVMVHLAAANLDEASFAVPLAFDVGRSPSPGHLSFGLGRHRCIGARLAQAELAVSLDAMAQAFPHLHIETPSGVPRFADPIFGRPTSPAQVILAPDSGSGDEIGHRGGTDCE